MYLIGDYSDRFSHQGSLGRPGDCCLRSSPVSRTLFVTNDEPSDIHSPGGAGQYRFANASESAYQEYVAATTIPGE